MAIPIVVQRPWARIVLAGLGLLLAAPPASAYVPTLQEIFARVSAQAPAIRTAVLETRTYVFDPLNFSGTAPQSNSSDGIPVELTQRSFRQKIWWIRNAFLGIETYADDGTLLHFYVHEGYRPVQENLGGERLFKEADVVHPYLPFVSADAARWQQAVSFWGLNPSGVAIARGAKGEVQYRLFEDDGKALWLEPGLLRPTRIQTRLLGAGGGQRLTLEFSEFLFIGQSDDDAENFFFPRTVNFLLDGRLFKQTVLLRFEADPSVRSFPVTRLRELAAKVLTERPSAAPEAR